MTTRKPYLISEAAPATGKSSWGLEVHVRRWRAIPSSSPAPPRSSAPTRTSTVSLVDAAMPGMLPVINRFCVEQAVKTGLGLNAQINLLASLRPEELFLSRPTAGLSDLAVQIAHRGRRLDRRGIRRRLHLHRRHRAPPPRTGRRQVDPRSRPSPRPMSTSTGPASP